MGVLYYFVREDNRTFFALNKWPHDSTRYASLSERAQVLQHLQDTPRRFALRYIWQPPSLAVRTAERLYAWADGKPVRFIAESEKHALEEEWGIDDDYFLEITGSCYDQHYTKDEKYIPGSAW